jgi:hypothetical protein
MHGAKKKAHPSFCISDGPLGIVRYGKEINTKGQEKTSHGEISLNSIQSELRFLQD